MILDNPDKNLKKLFKEESLQLPIRWDGNSYYKSLEERLDKYYSLLCKNKSTDCSLLYETVECIDDNCGVKEVKNIIDNILSAVKEYLNGFSAKAYDYIKKVMDVLMREPLNIYQKTDWYGDFRGNDPLCLFRVAKVSENSEFSRTRIFHTPFNLRSKVGTNRYSIPGFPCLYLGTSIELCLSEIHHNLNDEYIIGSLFKLERNYHNSNTEINVIELAIKPSDFYSKKKTLRIIKTGLDSNIEIQRTYLKWYPLIAACSFIRARKDDPFAPEYIVPQLLLQWIRNWNDEKGNRELYGIRYFSCASIAASEKGFNYVFPTNGESHQQAPNYCKILSNCFKLTKPMLTVDYNTIQEYENELINRARNNGLDYVFN